MRTWGFYACVVSLVGALGAFPADAIEFKRYDGIHRITKSPQVTERAVLGRRDEGICGTSMQLCPSSLDGGCCPENYDCAKESCYATTKGPSTCGTLVGWYVCDAVYGAGCCPDGYLCQTAGNCVPPSGSAYTYGCPASFTLCPASMSYGCCRTGMACAVNQCYSTEPVTLTTTMRITTTQEGVRATYELISTTIRTPEAPTVLPTVDADDNNGQAVFKYFPSAIAKATPTASTAPEKGGGGGLSKGTLAGIIAGSVAFLIIVLVAAFIIIRHLNNVVAAVSSKQSDGSRVRPPMKEFKPSNSEVDALSVDPLMLSPRPANPAPGSKVSSAYVSVASGVGSNDSTPVGPVDGYHQVSRNDGHSRQTSVDTPGNREDYFDIASGTPRFSQQSVSALPLMMNQRNSDPRGAYSHVRNWSNGSGGSDAVGPGAMWQQPLPSELEATPYVPELPSTPMRMESSRRSSGGEADVTRPMMTHQRNRSDQRSPIDSAGPPLTAVDEEIHGFHGPNDYFMGQTSYRPPGQGDGYSTTGHMSPR